MSQPNTNNIALNVGGALLGAMLAGALWFTLWALVYHEVPDKNANALLLVIGALTTNIATVVGWYFGGSLNSKQQSETIGVLANTNAAQTAAANPAPVIPVQVGETVTVAGTESTTP